jgi:hypothetical protein
MTYNNLCPKVLTIISLIIQNLHNKFTVIGCILFISHYIYTYQTECVPGSLLRFMKYKLPWASKVQGASGIDARFLELSPALTISPIMTKFSQYNPYSTCYLVLVSICRKDKSALNRRIRAVDVKIIRAG